MNQEETIFEQSLGIDSQAAREDFVREACGGNEDLFARLQGLLRAHDRAGKFADPAQRESTLPLGAGAAAGAINPLTEQPGDGIGRYKVLQRIGEGGCGVVYMAEQEEPVRRRVALKIIKLGMDTRQVIARFEAERQALALMDHPNIAKVHDAGATEAGRPYFVMELVRGVKITDYCDEKKLSTRERLELFTQVCRAVQHAHQKGIIHRDLKPSNILVSVNDGVAVPKVIDFGIAKATSGEPLTDKTVFTAFEQFIGTPAYMSPEQALVTNVDVDTRADIYALGVLLYELLTGQTPFDAKELMQAGVDEMRRTIRENEPDRPSTRVSTLPRGQLDTTAQRRGLEAPKLVSQLRGDLDWIAMKCLEKDRARRYETANGLATDVQRHLNNEPVVACPPSAVYRFQKMVRRNEMAFSAAIAVALALAAGVAVSTTLFFKEKKARQRAVAAELEQIRLRQQADDARAAEKQVVLRAQAKQQIADAKFVMRFNDRGESEKRIKAVYKILLQMDSKTAAATHYEFGFYLAELARWQEAATNFVRGIELEPNNYANYHGLMAVYLAIRDVKACESLRRLILSRYAAAKDRQICERVVKDCSILPWAKGDFETLGKLADNAVEGTSDHWAFHYFEFAKGLAEFRQGHFTSAVEWMERTLASPKEDKERNVEADMVLAMTYYQMSNQPAARRMFDQGVSVAGPISTNVLPPGTVVSHWIDWNFARALMREAAELIEGPSDTTTENQPPR